MAVKWQFGVIELYRLQNLSSLLTLAPRAIHICIQFHNQYDREAGKASQFISNISFQNRPSFGPFI